MSKTTPGWRSFEQLVGRIQRELAPSASVAENERIVGRSGVERRIDVTVRQTVSAYPVLIAIDCKRHRRRIDLGYVAAFADQARDVSASLAVLISNAGFTKGARAVARTHDLVLQTLREAEHTDWGGLLGPGAWTFIVGVTARDVRGVAVGPGGTIGSVDFASPAYDRHHQQVETVGELFWNWWKALGNDRKIGPIRFEALAASGEVFVRGPAGFEEVARFELTNTLVGTRWLVPLHLDHGHLLLHESGEPAYQEFTTSSFQWRQIMDTQEGEQISPEEFERVVKESRMSVDLGKAKRFLRLVLQTKPGAQTQGGAA